MDTSSYGVTSQTIPSSIIEIHCENLKRNGFSIVDSQIPDVMLKKIDEEIINLKNQYVKNFQNFNLGELDEQNTVRAPLLYSPLFFEICFNKSIIDVLSIALQNNFILNQQNVITNPAKKKYNQAHWHRDLPYQHLISSRPLAFNALFCVDDFRLENGSTFILPGSHLHEKFPSDEHIHANQLQITAKKGQFILIDSMVYHKGGYNSSINDRVAVNNVYTLPMIRRQIDFDANDFQYSLESFDAESILRLGLKYKSFKGVGEFLESRKK
jgi:hypothetical protein